jgi:preprotein translocase subunit SecE
MVKKRKRKTSKKGPAAQASSSGLDSAETEPEEGTPAPPDGDERDERDERPERRAGARPAADGDDPFAASDDGDDAARAETEADEGDGEAAEPADEELVAAGAKAADDDEDAPVATQLGAARYVIFGFFATWITGSYVAAKTLQGVWSWLSRKEWFGRTLPSVAAVPHEGELWSRSTISLLFGAIVAAAVVYVYYRKPDVRQWADEVAEQLGKVKWPTRKDVGSYTVVVLAVSAVMTVYLALLDRFWGFLTNLIYSSGL